MQSTAASERGRDVYAALDLGTNNCRLLVARPCASGLHIIDAFSRIVRLGEGLTLTGRLSDVRDLVLNPVGGDGL